MQGLRSLRVGTLRPYVRNKTYTFKPGRGAYITGVRKRLEIDYKLREERGLEYDKYKNVPVDPDDFTTGPKPWLNRYFPSNRSLLPVQLGYLPRDIKNDVPHELHSEVPNGRENQLHPTWQPMWFKSRLIFKLDDLKLSDLEKEIFIELVANRYNRRTGEVKFTSKALATRQANENRVYQYLDTTTYVIYIYIYIYKTLFLFLITLFSNNVLSLQNLYVFV